MYRYEAFFSYKRHSLSDEWHRQTMVHIQYWLSHSLGIQNAPIFFDTRSVENATLFNNEIDEALRTSKIIIAVWSPLYFTSPHCLAEIKTFMDREDALKLKRGSLIACARFHDGASYPSPFSEMQSEDFSPYSNIAKAFWSSRANVPFQKLLQDFATVAARKVMAVPPWNAGFPAPAFNGDGGPPLLPLPILRPTRYLRQAPVT